MTTEVQVISQSYIKRANLHNRSCQWGSRISVSLHRYQNSSNTLVPIHEIAECFDQNSQDEDIRRSHLVVEENPHYCCHHAHNVGGADRIAQHQEGYADDHDSLGGVGHGVAKRANQIEDTEGDHVLGKVTEATDQEEEKSTGPFRHPRLMKIHRREYEYLNI